MLFRYTWVAVAVAIVYLAAPLQADHSGQHHEGTKLSDQRPMNDASTRVRRQAQKRQGIFGLIGEILRQTKNDTESAYQQISKLISDSIDTGNTTTTAEGLTTPSSRGVDGDGDGEGPASPPTEGPYRATPDLIRSILRRNLIGILNLFQTQWRTAWVDSTRNVIAAGQEFRSAIRPIIAGNSTSSKTKR